MTKAPKPQTECATAADDINKLSTEQFAEKLDKGDNRVPSIIPSCPPNRSPTRANCQNTGRSHRDRAYKAKLVIALKTDVIKEIDRTAQEVRLQVDELSKDVDAAKNHRRPERAGGQDRRYAYEEHAKKFLGEEQEKITKEKLERHPRKRTEAITLLKDAIVNGSKPDQHTTRFRAHLHDAELEGDHHKGKGTGSF